MCWATFWAIFSQAHLVTLLTRQNGDNEKKMEPPETNGWLAGPTHFRKTCF
jgi:hypothetical protein